MKAATTNNPAAIDRRQALLRLGALTTLAIGAAQFARNARAQGKYPERPVRIINTAAAGGPYDIVARYCADKLTRASGTPFIVENVTGAGTTLGTAQALRAPVDGHTLLVHSTSTLAISPFLYKNLSYDPVSDMVPIWAVQSAGLVLSVHPSLPVNDVKEFVAYAKTNPGKVSFGSAGTGTVQHLAGEFFMRRTGIQLVHVPYRGGAPAMADLVAGHISCAFDSVSSVRPMLTAKKIRALAAIRATRSSAMPEIPTVAEAGIEGVALPTSFMGLWARAGTLQAIVDQIAAAMTPAFRGDPEGQERMARLGLGPITANGPEMAKSLVAEREIFGTLIREAGLTAE